MTNNQITMITALHRCTFLPGSFAKRFVRSIFERRDDPRRLTENQSRYLAELFHKYRKQIGSQDHNLYCELCQKTLEAQ